MNKNCTFYSLLKSRPVSAQSTALSRRNHWAGRVITVKSVQGRSMIGNTMVEMICGKGVFWVLR